MFEMERPGLLYVAATLLPLASATFLLLMFGLRSFLRQYRDQGGLGDSLFKAMGGDKSLRWPAYVATAAIAGAFLLCLTGAIIYISEAHDNHHRIHHLHHEIGHLQHDLEHAGEKEAAKLEKKVHNLEHELTELENRWSGSIEWAMVLPRTVSEGGSIRDAHHGTTLSVGYYLDNLSVTMFLMVTLIATLIHLFSMGYMSDELADTVEDHEVHTAGGHLHRRGRFGRFFLFLSLFCFSMLNLILADNLFQVFVSWELVGVCSFLLIGFYFERTSASNAANKAFITNRIGDAGFIIGLLILWTYVGTLNFQDVFKRIRCPDEAMASSHKAHGKHVNLEYAGRIVYGEPAETDKDGNMTLVVSQPGAAIGPNTQAVIFPRRPDSHFTGVGPRVPNNDPAVDHVDTYASARPDEASAIPYWLLVLAGLGIFLGCMGKSAQFPLQVWLPDAMEGPTPVSALIHAATMVAAGVYLVGRCYPLFTPEVLLTIAYTGAITLFVAATTAIVMTDIKKVLAYSTVSQLGYMMLALGVGGWAAGLFHLITHAFFKALLFLCSGSVIYGCHHVQEMPRMGGLFPKMKITAITMLIGVLAISGIPLFSGWYSKDAVLAHALGFMLVHKHHFLLFVLPLVTAGLTTFYMFRMWFMTFTGKSRDHHVFEHAHESPWLMTVPLIVLAFFSVTVAWGWPLWNAEASELEHFIHHAQPVSVKADFGVVAEVDFPANEEGHAVVDWHGGAHAVAVRPRAHENHNLAGLLAILMVAVGLSFASLVYYHRVLDPQDAVDQFPFAHRFLSHKWYFDELYSAMLVRPSLAISNWCRAFDTYVIDGFVNFLGWFFVKIADIGGLFDRYVVDGLVNLIARVSYGIGDWLRNFQTGYIRSYVLFLVLAAVGIWVVLYNLLVI